MSSLVVGQVAARVEGNKRESDSESTTTATVKTSRRTARAEGVLEVGWRSSKLV